VTVDPAGGDRTVGNDRVEIAGVRKGLPRP